MNRSSRTTLAAVGLAVVIALTGCAGTTGLTAEAGRQMQSTVVTAADQAAAGDTAGALATLDTLQLQLQQTIDSGDISTDRATTVQKSIDQVRADLQPPAPAETSAPPETPVTQDPSTTAPEPVTTTEPEPAPDDGNKPDKDKDKDKDKGNGKDD